VQKGLLDRAKRILGGGGSYSGDYKKDTVSAAVRPSYIKSHQKRDWEGRSYKGGLEEGEVSDLSFPTQDINRNKPSWKTVSW